MFPEPVSFNSPKSSVCMTLVMTNQCVKKLNGWFVGNKRIPYLLGIDESLQTLVSVIKKLDVADKEQIMRDMDKLCNLVHRLSIPKNDKATQKQAELIKEIHKQWLSIFDVLLRLADQKEENEFAEFSGNNLINLSSLLAHNKLSDDPATSTYTQQKHYMHQVNQAIAGLGGRFYRKASRDIQFVKVEEALVRLLKVFPEPKAIPSFGGTIPGGTVLQQNIREKIVNLKSLIKLPSSEGQWKEQISDVQAHWETALSHLNDHFINCMLLNGVHPHQQAETKEKAAVNEQYQRLPD